MNDSAQRSVIAQLGVLLLLGSVVFAGTLGAAWPYVAAAGVGMLVLRAAAAWWRMLVSK